MHLNNRQLNAVQYGNFPLLILAGAGTGKTTTIIERIAYSVKYNSIHPSQILALTFSVDAAENLKNRLSEKNIIDSDLITASTFHSFAKDIVDNNYSKLGYSKNPVLIDKDGLVYLFLKKIDSFKDFKSKSYNRFPIKAMNSILSIHDQFRQELFDDNDINNLKNYCIDKLSEPENQDNEVIMQLDDAVSTFNEFSKIKKEASFIEYEDMIYDLWNLINLDVKILDSLQQKFKFIIIDEFQDNNFAFSEIINKIAIHNNITVVGDDDQSIYSFRGSNSYNMLSFDKWHSKHSNYKKIELIENYRSNQKILDIANTIIINNENRMEKEFLVSKNTDCPNDSVSLHIGDKDSQLAEILKIINHFLNNDKTLAILCRTNSDCIAISKILDKNKILHNYTNDKLFEKKVIRDIIAFLNIITNSKYNLHALLRLTRDKFSTTFKENVIHLWRNNSNILFQCIENKDLFTAVENLWINQVRSITDKMKENNVSEAILQFIKNNYNLSSIENSYLNDFQNIAQKFYDIYNKDNSNNFCDYINLLADNNSFITKNDRVIENASIQLMTVHNSKGMEFDYVILPFLQSSKFPQSFKNPEFLTAIPLIFKKWTNEFTDPKIYHLEEERRLFYVACTRAKEKLYLLTTEKRQSKFIKEINEDLYLKNEIKITIPISKENRFEEIYHGIISSETLLLSASKLDNYSRCQLKYKYASLDLIPYVKYNSIFVLGNIIHKVLQQFHQNNLNGIDQALALLDKYWDSSLYFYNCESNQHYKDAKKMLENYCGYLDNNKPSPILFENYFQIKMKTYVLSGAIDRLDIDENNNIKIYDYKTSKTQKTKSNIRNSFQLPIYALATYLIGEKMDSRIKNQSDTIQVGELSLRFNDLERSIELHESDIKEIEIKVNNIAKQISSKVFIANPNIINCNYCDYKKFICSYYN